MKRALVKRCLAFLFAATLLVCACACSRVQTPQADKTLDLSGMELVFEENFDGPLDATRWRTTRGEGARRGGYWDPAQCFTQDGNLITSRVGIYPPNEFGLYDMAGNVSEWTSTAYTESVDRYTSDMNPDYRYNAAKEDPYRMKRKIVRGGSWKDVSNFVRSDIRMWEYQNEQRSYIGFRCVRTQVGFAKGRRN